MLCSLKGCSSNEDSNYHRNNRYRLGGIVCRYVAVQNRESDSEERANKIASDILIPPFSQNFVTFLKEGNFNESGQREAADGLDNILFKKGK
jgi:hypothetical protein